MIWRLNSASESLLYPAKRDIFFLPNTTLSAEKSEIYVVFIFKDVVFNCWHGQYMRNSIAIYTSSLIWPRSMKIVRIELLYLYGYGLLCVIVVEAMNSFFFLLGRRHWNVSRGDKC